MNLPRRTPAETAAHALVRPLDNPAVLDRVLLELGEFELPICSALEAVACPSCGGAGEVPAVQDGWSVRLECTFCDTEGIVCPRCHGVLAFVDAAGSLERTCVDCAWHGAP